jgi:transketolase
MRKQFVKTVEEILGKDEKTVLILGDIGVFGFRKAFETHPTRVYNIGILEQATMSAASGLSMTGLVPIIHTIAPFITERCFEQIKHDFGYQKLSGNIVSVGASYDYASLGCTHHCPADVGILKNIPGIEIVVPGTPSEFDTLFRQAYNNGRTTYFRLSERPNKESNPVAFGKAHVIKKGKKATVIAVGPMLSPVLEALGREDVTILYYTTIEPFDTETLIKNTPSNKILLCEPYYEGALTNDISQAFPRKPLLITNIGIERKFIHAYGKPEEHDEALELTPQAINKKLKVLLG